jgi:phospholipid-transporting ATPase
VPQISDTNRQPTIGIPLSIVVFASVIKDWVEDRKRAHNDHLQNSQKVNRAEPGEGYKEETWQNIKVGQIVRVKRNQTIPADLILLAASQG